MNIANIDITRVIAHEVVRASQIAERPPILSDQLVTLDTRGKDLVGKRLVTTVASGSHCIDVAVDVFTVGSPFDHATAMLDSTNEDYVSKSRHLAHELSTAQTAGPIKSGSAIFVQGSCIADGRQARFLSIIKADCDQGFYMQVENENITLKYVHDMLLSDSQRLIKIAFFIEESTREAEGTIRSPDEFSVKVFDHMMQNSGDRAAAAYFYSSFLKCRIAENASRKTKQFYEAVREFVDRLAILPESKVELHGDLISYLRSNRTIIEPREFAQEVLPEAHQDAFIRKCTELGINEAISKDTQLIKGKLKRQSLKFSSNVTLYAPPDSFRDSVHITGTTADGWTELKIRGSIEEMT